MSIAQGYTIYVYTADKSRLLYTFSFVRKAALHFDVFKDSILKYARNGELYKNEWIISNILL